MAIFEDYLREDMEGDNRFLHKRINALEVEKSTLRERVRDLEARVAERDRHIEQAYAALRPDANRAVYLFDHIRKLKEQLAEMTENRNLWADDHGDPCTHKAALDEAQAQVQRLSAEWKSLPDSQGDWWHWYGHPDVAPFIYGILVSHTGSDRYFIQHPDSRWCDEVGGIWCKINPPSRPSRQEFKKIIANRLKERDNAK